MAFRVKYDVRIKTKMNNDAVEKSRDSSVGTALGYGLDDRDLEFDSRRGLGVFLFTTVSRLALGPI
jgi:hypothetical protein